MEAAIDSMGSSKVMLGDCDAKAAKLVTAPITPTLVPLASNILMGPTLRVSGSGRFQNRTGMVRQDQGSAA